jgi:hypothetical protein
MNRRGEISKRYESKFFYTISYDQKNIKKFKLFIYFDFLLPKIDLAISQ